MSTPAGWYGDPSGDPSWQRWWDGAQWTQHVQPVHQPHPVPQPAPGSDPVSGPSSGRGTGLVIGAVLGGLGLVAVAVVVLLLVARGAGGDDLDGTPLTVPGTPYQLGTPEGWERITDPDEILFGRAGAFYEPVPQGQIGAAVTVHTAEDGDLLVPPSSSDPERVAVSNAHDFLAFYFPESVEFMSSTPVEGVQTLVHEAVEMAGVEGYRVTFLHEEPGVLLDAVALGGPDPLLIIGAGSAIDQDPGLQESITAVVGSVRQR